MDDGCTEKNIALVHPYHKGKWCNKLGWITPSGLGGDSVTDGGRTTDARKDGHTENDVALAYLIMRGSDVSSLVEFHPVV